MMKKLKLLAGGKAGTGFGAIALALICVLCFAGCDIPALLDDGTDDGMAVFSLYLGGGGARNAATPELYDHTVLLTNGPGPDQTHTAPKGTTSITLQVLPGTWTITVRAFLDGALQYEGTTVQNITVSGNNGVSVTMREAGPVYTVSFDGNVSGDAPDGVTGVPAAITGVKNGSAITRPEPNPQRTGYTFAGWYREAACTTAWDFAADTVTGDITLYARWTENPPNTFTVTFVADGGSPVPPDQPADNDGKITPPAAMTKPGYTFGGWYTDAACTTVWDFAGDTVTADITLYARWTENPPNTFTVTFEVNGGSPSLADRTVTSGNKAVPPADITKTGHTFSGWYREAACTTAWDFASDTVTADITLYAKWTANTYTVSFDSQGGNAVSSATVNHGSIVTKPAPDPTKTGYAFDGWYRDTACTNAWNFTSDTVTADITLYAKWTPTYTVTFNADGGSPAPSAQTVISGNKAVPPAMTKTGHAFDTWYEDDDFVEPWDFTTDTVTGDITLYAKWIPTYTVSFDGNAPPGVTVNYVPEDINDVRHGDKIDGSFWPGRTGYAFDGWYTEAACTSTNQWDFNTDAVTADTTLYAKWTFTGGAEDDPFLIGNAATLALIGTAAYPMDGHYKLTADIPIPTDWVAIGNGTTPFTGSFDGGGKTVTFSGSVAANNGSVGLFGRIGQYSGKKGMVRNLKTAGTLTISGEDYTDAGSIAGQLEEGTIENCASETNISVTSTNTSAVGGIVGSVLGNSQYPNGTIKNCYATGNVSATGTNYGYAGGIAGDSHGNIENCYVSGTVSATGSNDAGAGGIAGAFSGTNITNCVALGTSVSATGGAGTSWKAGSVYGSLSGPGGAYITPTKTNCYADSAMTVTGDTTAGYAGTSATIATMQADTWWSDTAGFNFGDNAAAPWKWDTTDMRPVLWFEIGD